MQVKNLVSLHKANMMLIVEPKIQGKKVEDVIQKLGFSGCLKVDPLGFSKGLWLLWNEQVCHMTCIKLHEQFIHARIILCDNSFSRLIMKVHGSLNVGKRMKL